MNDLIAAVATPVGSGGISIIRLSGEGAVAAADRFFVSVKGLRPSSFSPRVLYLGNFVTDSFKEQCLCVHFAAPDSFTGEDVIEFQIHGGVYLTQAILNALFTAGARSAEAGEFSKRAFLNGKLSLAAAEGVIEVINAQSEAEINAGYDLMTERLSGKVKQYQDRITDIIARIEVALDYPEEDIEVMEGDAARAESAQIAQELRALANTYQTGKSLAGGINVAIVGCPNVGKSSLLNALLGYDRAIVTPIAGTTRDTISESYVHKGVRVNIIDTAGLRESDDPVEQIGIERSKRSIDCADLVIMLSDGLSGVLPMVESINRTKTAITVFNKSDTAAVQALRKADPDILAVSALTGEGIAELKDTVYGMFIDSGVLAGGVVLTSQRHYSALVRAHRKLERAQDLTDLSLLTLELRAAADNLAQITGSDVGEEVIDRIFSKFCLGK